MSKEKQLSTIHPSRTLDVRVLPIGRLETSISNATTEQRSFNTRGPFMLIDAARIHMTSSRTDDNPHFPRIAGSIDYPTALEAEMRRRYGRGGAVYDATVAAIESTSRLNGSAPTKPLAVEVIPRENVKRVDPDPERNLFLAAKEMLLTEAQARYPEFFPPKKVQLKDSDIYIEDPNGHLSDSDSDARFRTALEDSIATRKNGRIY